MANSLRPLGELLVGLGRSDEALPALEEAAMLFAQLQDPASEVEMLSYVAKLREGNGRVEESIERWKRIHALWEQLGNTSGQLDALEATARVIRRLGPPADAAIAALEAALAMASAIGDRARELSLCNSFGILEWQRERYADAPHVGHSASSTGSRLDLSLEIEDLPHHARLPTGAINDGPNASRPAVSSAS